MKKLLVVGVIVLFLGLAIAPSINADLKQSNKSISSGNTLYVGGSGPNNYTKIQDAIDDASDGDTVFVYDDSSPYYENLEVDKSINLIGEDRDTTKIRNDWEDNYAVNISVDLVNISGFSIEMGEIGIEIHSNYNTITGNNILETGTGIEIYSSYNNITGNNFSYNWIRGIYLDSSHNNTITDNIIKSYWDEEIGIELSDFSSNNTITGNTILNHDVGIHLSDSSNNTIKDNNFSGNWNCIDAYDSNNNTIKDNNFPYNVHGIILQKNCMNNTITGNNLSNISCCQSIGVDFSSNNNTVSNNTIKSFGWTGILIQFSRDNTVIGNMILDGRNGIYLWDSSNNTISCNNIINCKEHGIDMGTSLINEYYIHLNPSRYDKIHGNNIPNNSYSKHHFYSSNNNTIYHNNIIYNAQNARDGCNNTWDNDYPSGGNFWDDYNGTDDDGDGIGDTPYHIPGGDNEDRYPLMEPYGNFTLPPIAKYIWTPSLPDPNETILFNASESIDYDGYITLYEWDWDNDGEFDENHTVPTAIHSWYSYGYYPVTLRITDNDNLTDTKTKTVRVGNQPPNEPSYPHPEDGATDVDIEVTLNWIGGDPDGDKVTFDVYLGTTTPPPKIASNQTSAFYDPGTMDFNTTYYWQIVAWDIYNASTVGSIWTFTTIPAHLEIVIVKPVEKSFYLRNTLLFPLPRNTIIIGYIRITVNATSDIGIKSVEFYINDKLRYTDNISPYIYTWTRDRLRFIHLHRLTVVAYDKAGNSASDEIIVRKFL